MAATSRNTKKTKAKRKWREENKLLTTHVGTVLYAEIKRRAEEDDRSMSQFLARHLRATLLPAKDGG
jgi:hypothetical protein